MKKLLLFIGMALMLSLNAYAAVGDRFTVTDEAGNDLLRLDVNNQFTAPTNGVTLGSALNPWSTISVSSFTKPINAHEIFIDVIAISTVAIYSKITSTATLCISSGFAIPASAFVAQMNTPRSVTIAASFVTGKPTQTITGTYKITGVSTKGDVITESFSPTSTALYESSNTFVYVSSINIVWTTCNEASQIGTEDVKVDIGYGNHIGLANHIANTNDVYGVKENNVMIDHATSTKFNTTYDYYVPATSPNASYDYEVWYRIRKAP